MLRGNFICLGSYKFILLVESVMAVVIALQQYFFFLFYKNCVLTFGEGGRLILEVDLWLERMVSPVSRCWKKSVC